MHKTSPVAVEPNMKPRHTNDRQVLEGREHGHDEDGGTTSIPQPSPSWGVFGMKLIPRLLRKFSVPNCNKIHDLGHCLLRPPSKRRQSTDKDWYPTSGGVAYSTRGPPTHSNVAISNVPISNVDDVCDRGAHSSGFHLACGLVVSVMEACTQSRLPKMRLTVDTEQTQDNTISRTCTDDSPSLDIPVIREQRPSYRALREQARQTMRLGYTYPW